MKTVIELDRNLKEGELLIYKDGKLQGITIRELLPELKDFPHFKERLKEAEDKIRELRGED